MERSWPRGRPRQLCVCLSLWRSVTVVVAHRGPCRRFLSSSLLASSAAAYIRMLINLPMCGRRSSDLYPEATGSDLLWARPSSLLPWFSLHPQTNSLAFSPQAYYTDWATTTCQLYLVPTFVDRRVMRGQRGGSPTIVNLSFLNQSHYFSFK
jgi:hypothetical protein